MNKIATLSNGQYEQNSNFISPENIRWNNVAYSNSTLSYSKLHKGQGGANDLKGVAIPVRISGNLNDPSFMVDLEAALKANAEHKIEEKKSGGKPRKRAMT